MTTTAPAPDTTAAGRRGRTLRRSCAQRLAQAERAIERERAKRAEAVDELRGLRAEVRRLHRLMASTDAGRLVELRAQLERAREELREWRAGRR